MKKVTTTPVYIPPRTTYNNYQNRDIINEFHERIENEYRDEIPVRSENQYSGEPEPPRRTRQSFYVPEPEYYR